jgi:hypothetical protein
LILAIVFFIAFCFVISKLSFFKDAILTLKLIYVILFIKCLGCLAYYWIYFCYYPAGFNGDSVSTLHDAKIMYDALPNHPLDYIKMIFGWHSDLDSDPLYEPYFQYIEKWGRADVTSDYFLNDNRTPIRINAVIMLFSFGHYAVHALVMLIISFVGQFAFYKTFKKYFPKKELLLVIVIFLTPSILFWTSGVLKEPIAIFLVGFFVFSFMKLFVDFEIKLKYILCFLFSVLLFLIIKPYILILILIPLVVFSILKRFDFEKQSLFKIFGFYALIVSLIYSSAIFSLKYFFHKDVINTIVVRQNDFVSLSRGGIFFINDKNYLRLEYKDTTQYRLVDKKNNLYCIKPHTSLMFWDLHNLRDTIYIKDNIDTTTLYNFKAICAPSGSAIDIDRLTYSFNSFAHILPQSFYNVLCKPLFFDSHSLMELIASFENLLFIVLFGFCIFNFDKSAINKNLLVCFVMIVFTSFILIGLTTTVTGAIVRYKITFIPFLLLIPIMYLNPATLKRIPFFKRLFNTNP